MIDSIFAAVRATADGWMAEALRRLAIWEHDPVATTLKYCAGELLNQVEEMEKDERVTVEQYARDHQRTPQTIRAWIRHGSLPAVKGPNGYEIPRSAKVRPRAPRSAAA